MGDLSGSDSRYRASEAKHGERSCSDYRVSRQNSRALENLTHRPSDGMRPTGRVSGRE